MSKETTNKPTDEKERELEDEQDEDEEEDDEEDEDEEEDEEEAEAHAAPGKGQGHGHGHAGKPVAPSGEEDSSWWVPHVVLGVLVLVGVLGFFGLFNKPLGFLAAKPAGGTTETETHTQAAATPTPPPRPQEPAQMPQQRPQPEMFGAKHLVVMHKESMRVPPNITRTKEEAKARAEEALKKIKGGAKFEDVVGEYSDEPNAGQRGGDLGFFAKGRMDPRFQEGVEKLKVGETSGVVETSFGYHIIQRTK